MVFAKALSRDGNGYKICWVLPTQIYILYQNKMNLLKKHITRHGFNFVPGSMSTQVMGT